MIFLIEYDRGSGTLSQIQAFGDMDFARANSVRLELELARLASGSAREIVILEAESESQLRRTHRRYFESIESLIDPDAPLSSRKAA